MLSQADFRGKRRDDLLVNLIADVRLALKRDHVGEGRALGHRNRRVGLVGVFVADVLDKQQ
jgi:hypothetical protein